MSERDYSDDADTNDGRVTVWALQDLKESLDAIAEQLRIANLLEAGEARVVKLDPWDFGSDLPDLKPEVREALGL